MATGATRHPPAERRFAAAIAAVATLLLAACDELRVDTPSPTPAPVGRKLPAPSTEELLGPGHPSRGVERTAIPACRRPLGLALDRDGRLFVACGLLGQVQVIDPAAPSVLETWSPVYEHLYRVVALPDLARLAAVGMAGGFVHVFDTVTGRLVERIPAGRNIADIKLWPGMPGVLVAATEERQVHAIDLALLKIERSFEFPEPIGYIAVGESGRVAAAATGVFAVSRTGARLKEGRVYLFNPHENAAPRASDALVAGTASREPIFVRDDTLLLVPNFGAATVSAFDVETRKLYRTLDVGAGPERVVTGPDGNLAYVMNTRGASVTVIRLSPLEVVRHVPLPGNPERAVVSPDGRFLIATLPRPRGGDDGDGEPMPSPSWAPSTKNGARAPAIDDSPGNRVVLVDLRTFTVADIIPARDDPADIVSSADGRRVFVANFGDDSVSIFE